MAVLALEAETITVGRSPSSHVHVDDGKVSRHHAVIEPAGARHWRLTDLDSSNGTILNGRRLQAPRLLRHHDRIAIGDAELVFETEGDGEELGATKVTRRSKRVSLTRREQDVLAALCSSLWSDAPFPGPAATREISASLGISESAVRHHLERLYAKFEIYDDDVGRRRRQLASEALRRGSVVRDE